MPVVGPTNSSTEPSGLMEVVSANGRRVIVARDVDVKALLCAWTGGAAVNPFPIGTGLKVWLSMRYANMRGRFPSLALRVQKVFKHVPLSGHLFVFRGSQIGYFEDHLA